MRSQLNPIRHGCPESHVPPFLLDLVPNRIWLPPTYQMPTTILAHKAYLSYTIFLKYNYPQIKYDYSQIIYNYSQIKYNYTQIKSSSNQIILKSIKICSTYFDIFPKYPFNSNFWKAIETKPSYGFTYKFRFEEI